MTAAAVLISLLAFTLGATSAGAAGGSWPVYHHDAARTGVADAGPGLSAPTQRWATPSLDGTIYAEPVVSGPIVIVVTENDTVYGLAASSGHVVWHRHLAAPAPLSLIHSLGVPCGNIDPLGITSTPVIDQNLGEVFVVAEVDTGSNVAHQLFGLDVTNGQVMLPATSVDPPTLKPAAEQQRAALALGNDRVYVNFGGLAGDCGPYKGAVDSVREDGTSPVSYIVPTTREGGIWGPSGPAISSNGNVYVAVGNGAQTDPSKFDGSDSVTELSPTLNRLSIFAPSGWASDNAADADLGSTGPELLQNGEVFQVGKRGDAYLLSASNLGGIGKQLGTTHICDASFGGQAYAAPVIYVACNDGVRAVRVNAQNNGFNVLWQGPSAATGPPILGGGLVWVVGNDHSMYGLDPSTGNPTAHFAIPGTEHFVTPTVAAGELIVGTGTTVEAYGPPAGPPIPQPVVSSPQFGVANQTDVFDVAGDGAVEVSWDQGSGSWHGPMRISGPGLAPAGARLAVSQQFGIPNQTDVFVVGMDGAAHVLWVDGGGAWHGPLRISGTGLAPAGAALAASQQFGISDQTDVFVVGNDEASHVVWVDGGGGWQGPLRISGAGLAPAGAGLAASPQFGVANQTDVFVVGNDGAARVSWVSGAGRWRGPLAISPAGLAPAGAGLAASAQFGVANQTDVFVVADNGGTRVVWVSGAGHWNGPLAISPANMAPPGVALAASAQFGVANQTDVFEVADDAVPEVLSVQGGGQWHGPLVI